MREKLKDAEESDSKKMYMRINEKELAIGAKVISDSKVSFKRKDVNVVVMKEGEPSNNDRFGDTADDDHSIVQNNDDSLSSKLPQVFEESMFM